MTTTLAISTTVSHISQKLGEFFRFLPSSPGTVADHYTDNVEDLTNRIFLKHQSGLGRGVDSVTTHGRWWSYFFYRSTITPEVDRPKNIAGRVKPGTPEEHYVVLRVLPYAKTTIDYNIVSNDMALLEDLEESILLRTTVLTQEFTVEIEDTDFAFSMQYSFLDGSISYRVNPTELGSLSILNIPIEIRYPIMMFPKPVKEIRRIVFRILLAGTCEPIKVIEITPPATPGGEEP